MITKEEEVAKCYFCEIVAQDGREEDPDLVYLCRTCEPIVVSVFEEGDDE